jgi:hypothetical protein
MPRHRTKEPPRSPLPPTAGTTRAVSKPSPPRFRPPECESEGCTSPAVASQGIWLGGMVAVFHRHCRAHSVPKEYLTGTDARGRAWSSPRLSTPLSLDR